MISSLGAILVWKSDDDVAAAAADDYDDDRKSDPYMSPSYAGDTTMLHNDVYINVCNTFSQAFMKSMSIYLCI